MGVKPTRIGYRGSDRQKTRSQPLISWVFHMNTYERKNHQQLSWSIFSLDPYKLGIIHDAAHRFFPHFLDDLSFFPGHHCFFRGCLKN